MAGRHCMWHSGSARENRMASVRKCTFLPNSQAKPCLSQRTWKTAPQSFPDGSLAPRSCWAATNGALSCVDQVLETREHLCDVTGGTGLLQWGRGGVLVPEARARDGP